VPAVRVRGSISPGAEALAGVVRTRLSTSSCSGVAGCWLTRSSHERRPLGVAIRAELSVDVLLDQVAQYPTYSEAYLASLERLNIRRLHLRGLHRSWAVARRGPNYLAPRSSSP
jgi:hypothetical protein